MIKLPEECSQKSVIDSLTATVDQLNNALTDRDQELANTKRQLNVRCFFPKVFKK
jgi:hypothetical protein